MEPKTELQLNAIATARRKELESFQRALDIQWLNSRMEDGRMGRSLALIKREDEMEKEFQERTDHAAIVNARAAKEIALGIEIAKVRREEVCKLQRRHYLRERDPSLRELSKKLQAGYVCRDLRLQIQNNEYKKLQNKAEDLQSEEILRGALYNNILAKEHEEKEKMERTTRYCKELQQQLVNREQQRQCTYEDSLIEKKMLEDIMRTLADEDQRELAQKIENTNRLRGEMVTFQKARVAWKEKQKQMVINEERDIEKQKAAAADRSSAITAERERKMRVKEEINERMSAKILADEATRQERDNIIKLLQEQEYLEKNVNDDIAEKTKLERIKKDTNDALITQMETKKRLNNEQRILEEQFRKKTEDKMAALNREEHEKELKKQQKAKEYSKQLLQQIEGNAVRRKKEHEVEEARARCVWDSHAAWQAEVQEERAQIVAAHVPAVLGYLQAGVLRAGDAGAGGLGAAGAGGPGAARPQRFSKCNAQCRILREF